MDSLILRTATRVLVPVLLLFSVFLLLRGHNEPGGGFIGGLVAAVAYVLYGLAYNESMARDALRFDTRMFTALGLLIAVVSGVFSAAGGQSFMTSIWGELELFGLVIKLGTPLLFDIGVYLVVVGVTLTIVLAMAEE